MYDLFMYFFFLMIRLPPRSTRTDTLFPYTTLFRSARRALYMACWSVIRYQPDFNARYKALREKSKCAKVALIACMRVLLVRLNAMIRDGSERSEERRVGKECVSTCRSRWSQDH